MRNTNKQELIDFEDWVIDEYHKGKIRSPCHLSRGNEDQLIKIFEKIPEEDWIFTTYRSHYHALLKGVPKKWLRKWILDNKSIHVMNRKHKIVSSAIVGGTLSQAVGVAMAIKRKFEMTKETKFTGPLVWVFIGDMTASLGLFNDCYNYSIINDLPIAFIIEDNGLSTDTPTKEAWGKKDINFWWEKPAPNLFSYKYKRELPHYGTGKRVDFKT